MRALQKNESYAKDVEIGTSIYEINNDPAMTGVVLDSFWNIGYPAFRIFFLSLKKLHNDKANAIIERYTHDPDYFVSYSANKALTFEWPKIKPVE